MTDAGIRDAATVILWRHRAGPEVLMGQRGANAAFMPSKMVFPGGAADPSDAEVPLAGALDPVCRTRLGEDAVTAPEALAVAAIREVWEETGLVLGRAAAWSDPPEQWKGFAARGARPDASALTFVFRAITPPGRPRRFDARFFLAPSEAVLGDPDDFGQATDELSNLQWIPLDRVRDFDLPFITEVALAEVAGNIAEPGPPVSVPFFRNDDEESLFRWLRGTAPAADQ